MGMAEVTTLHTLGIGKSKLSPSLEAKSSLLGDSSRMACSDGDPLWAVAPTAAPKSSPSGNRLKLSKWSAMNSRSSKWIAPSWVSSMSNKYMSLVETTDLSRMNHQNIQRKSTLQIPLPGMQTLVVFYTSKIQGGQNHAF
jgi:hypothetical protein